MPGARKVEFTIDLKEALRRPHGNELANFMVAYKFTQLGVPLVFDERGNMTGPTEGMIEYKHIADDKYFYRWVH